MGHADVVVMPKRISSSDGEWDSQPGFSAKTPADNNTTTVLTLIDSSRKFLGIQIATCSAHQAPTLASFLTAI